MFNFKTKRYYKNSLKIQMSNNKMINEHLMKEKKYSQELSITNNSLFKTIEEMTNQIDDYKKEIKVLKTKATRFSNELKRIKTDNTRTIPEKIVETINTQTSSKSILEKIKKGEI